MEPPLGFPARFVIFLAALVLSLQPTSMNTNIKAAHATPDTDFIISSCSRTLHRAICLTTLQPLAPQIRSDPVLLASAALNASLASANAASATILSASSASSFGTGSGPIKDCNEEVVDAVQELRRSAAEMAKLGGQRLGEQVDNLQTWVSAALTDVDTCLDGIRGAGGAGGSRAGIRTSMAGGAAWVLVRQRVEQAAQLASNALCFINGLIAH